MLAKSLHFANSELSDGMSVVPSQTTLQIPAANISGKYPPALRSQRRFPPGSRGDLHGPKAGRTCGIVNQKAIKVPASEQSFLVVPGLPLVSLPPMRKTRSVFPPFFCPLWSPATSQEETTVRQFVAPWQLLPALLELDFSSPAQQTRPDHRPPSSRPPLASHQHQHP